MVQLNVSPRFHHKIFTYLPKKKFESKSVYQVETKLKTLNYDDNRFFHFMKLFISATDSPPAITKPQTS